MYVETSLLKMASWIRSGVDGLGLLLRASTRARIPTIPVSIKARASGITTSARGSGLGLSSSDGPPSPQGPPSDPPAPPGSPPPTPPPPPPTNQCEYLYN